MWLRFGQFGLFSFEALKAEPELVVAKCLYKQCCCTIVLGGMVLTFS